MACHKVAIITYVQLLGHRPLKFWECKNVQNLVQFLTAFEFDRKYLKNRCRYQTLETNLIDGVP